MSEPSTNTPLAEELVQARNLRVGDVVFHYEWRTIVDILPVTDSDVVRVSPGSRHVLLSGSTAPTEPPTGPGVLWRRGPGCPPHRRPAGGRRRGGPPLCRLLAGA